MLGNALQQACKDAAINCAALKRTDINFKDRKQLIERIDKFDVLIHAGANTNVERCELDPYSAYKDNTLLTEVLSSACYKSHVKFVYISSTGVYGVGKDEPYHEYDVTVPTTHYHRSKLLGELAALQSNASLVVRTGWLFGGSTHNPKNFVAARLKEASLAQGIIRSNNQQQGNPTYVMDLASRLLEIIKNDLTGIFNCVNEGVASRLDYVRAIIELAAIPIEVEPIPASNFKRVANVSHNEAAINLKLMQCGYEPMADWKSSLSKYVSLISAGGFQ